MPLLFVLHYGECFISLGIQSCRFPGMSMQSIRKASNQAGQAMNVARIQLKKCIFPLLIVVLVMVNFSSCPLFSNSSPNTPAPDGSGAMIVRHGSYIYKIGGKDSDGSIVSTVLMAKIDIDTSTGKPIVPLNWQATGSLPEGRAFGVAFDAGNIMYVLGGDNGSGPTSTIYYARIDPTDGTIGYDADKHWIPAQNRLDEPRSHAAWGLDNGRIFLIGGKNGEAILDSIVHARIYFDGTIGPFYTSPVSLPSPRYDAAATIQNGSLFVAGGVDSSDSVVREMISYDIGAYGLLSNRTTAYLPKPLFAPVFLGDGDSLILGGGYSTGQKASTSVYRWKSGGWDQLGTTIDAAGPSSGRAAGTLWYLKQVPGSGGHGIGQNDSLQLGPERLNIVPGSGLVPSGVIVRLKAEPGTVVHYTLGSTDVTRSDPVWNDDNTSAPNKISAAGTISFRAFVSTPGVSNYGAGTPLEQRDFTLRQTGFFVFLSGDLQTHDSNTTIDTINLRENMSSSSSAAQKAIWCRLRIYQKEKLALYFKDYDADPANYTARVKLSFYEYDYCGYVLDDAGMPIVDYTTKNKAQPILLTLSPGEYYLRIIDLDSQSGGTMGLAFVKR